MKILPEHIFERTSHLAPDEVIRRIKQRSEPSWDKFRYLKSGKTFAGQVVKNSFKLIRIDPIRSKNRPLITGKVIATDSGSKITIQVGYRQNQSLFFLSIILVFIFLAMSSFIPNKLAAASVTILMAIVVMGILRMDFERECHEVEEAFDRTV